MTMRHVWRVLPVLLLVGVFLEAGIVRRVIREEGNRENLLQANAWKPWGKGFGRQDGVFFCANGEDVEVERGAGQTVVLNQQHPQTILATAWSKSEGVTGGRNSDYSLYLDILYMDGTPQWGQISTFDTGTHDWQKRRVFFFPDKPIRSVSYYLLLRRHGGRAWFRDAKLYEMRSAGGVCRYDGVPVQSMGKAAEGVMIRDVKSESDFVDAASAGDMGLRVETKTSGKDGVQFVDLTVSSLDDRDRALVVYYRCPVPEGRVVWFADAFRQQEVEAGSECAETVRFAIGGSGRLSRYPFAAVQAGGHGMALGFDPDFPVFGHLAYNHAARELFVACDVALTREKSSAVLRFVRFPFASRWGFRGALDAYMKVFPEAFVCRASEQGLWMPFAKISEVKGWQDFGFKFKEGNNETAWDDAHNITTFRYTEPMTWWMRMPKEMPKNVESAMAHAQKCAEDPTHRYHRQAQALFNSGYHDKDGNLMALIRDTPWCDGAVWSMNSTPGIKGRFTDFKLKWNPELRKRLYGPARKGDLDGEYVDSSEGYVTGELNFRRGHFSKATRPLTFCLDGFEPAIFRGLNAFEYVRAIEKDVHAMGKLMMANSTPSRLWWLAPRLDVLGTETNWNRNGEWRPMTHRDLFYRRSLCGPKPFCFLMNTKFDDFSHELVEKYMKRSLAYGMFPGFFSADASTGQYFRQPALYDRDRGLFKRYIPLCKRIAEAGWSPIPKAATAMPDVYLERFGERFLTVFNDGGEERDVSLAVEFPGARLPEDLLGHCCEERDGKLVVLRLGAEDLAVLDFSPDKK